MRALLTATAILLVALPAVAQPKKLHVVNAVNTSHSTTSASPNSQVDVGAPRWKFDLVKIQHYPGWATAKHVPYGVFATKYECEMARAKVVVDLDNDDLRQFHPLPDITPTDNTSLTLRTVPDKQTAKQEMTSDKSMDTVSLRKRSLSDIPTEFMHATACDDRSTS
jgi:hypothetical protein